MSLAWGCSSSTWGVFRNAHEVSLREALSWSVVRITLVLYFVGIKMTIVDLYIETSLG